MVAVPTMTASRAPEAQCPAEPEFPDRPVLVADYTDAAIMARICRPEACNAISLKVIQALDRLVEDIASSGTVKPFVLLGEGRYFASGGDLRQFATFDAQQA